MNFWYIGQGKNDTWSVTLVTTPLWAEVLDTVGDRVCGLSGHRLERLYGLIVNLVYRHEKTVMTMPITEEQAVALGWKKWNNNE